MMAEPDFIYWRHPTPPGIKVEEVCGGDIYGGATWMEMARQLYCENGRDAYRDIGHFKDGAPFLFGETTRISVTHCRGLFAVATLPPTPEVDLAFFSERAALGIDAEWADRTQVLRIRERFLNAVELDMVPADDILSNVVAWTVKEAAYKAARTPGLDFRSDISIRRLPVPAPPTPVFDPGDFPYIDKRKDLPAQVCGEVVTVMPGAGSDGEVAREVRFNAYTYLSEDCVVTLCYSPRCAKFGKSAAL